MAMPETCVGVAGLCASMCTYPEQVYDESLRHIKASLKLLAPCSMLQHSPTHTRWLPPEAAMYRFLQQVLVANKRDGFDGARECCIHGK